MAAVVSVSSYDEAPVRSPTKRRTVQFNDTAEEVKGIIDSYVTENSVAEVVEDMISALLKAKPDNPQQWLLEKLEKDLSDESDELSEECLHKLFAVTRKITAEIVPRDTIDMVIKETMQMLNCDIVSLFVLERKTGMLLLFASNLDRDTPIRISPGQGIAGTVFNVRQTVNIPDCYRDRRFDKSFDKESGYSTRSLIAVPIIDYERSTVGVIQAINKLPGELDKSKSSASQAIPFERIDEKILHHLAQHVAIAMRNSEVFREAIGSTERATGLLNMIQCLSQDLGTQSLLLTITMHANKIVSSERSTVFLVDEHLQQLWSVSTDTGQEIRIPKKAGIAGQCCCEGLLINITDAYADSRFNQVIDKKTGFKTHSILAVPMFSDGEKAEQPAVQGQAASAIKAHHVIGVIQMINKVSYDGQPERFDQRDIEVMELFAAIVGPKLKNSAMLQQRGSEVRVSDEAQNGLRKVPDSFKEAAPEHGRNRSGSKHHPELIEEGGGEAEDEEDELGPNGTVP